MNKINIIKIAQVEDVKDDADGLRIKARLPQEKGQVSELPYAFPLLPKTFQSVPKVGEGVIILTMESDNKESDRFYIGPIISQPQFQEKCTHSYGRGASMSLLNERSVKPEEKISNHAETVGAFPAVADVAVVGRQGQDITLRQTPGREEEEIDIRCGIRKQATAPLIGKVIFNNVDPAYIQLKYGVNIASGVDKNGVPVDANSVVNIAADRINIISTKDLSLNSEVTNPENLISDLAQTMNDLHQVPLGDRLVDFLNKFVTAFLNHVHNHNLKEPSDGTLGYQDLKNYQINEILSEYVRIS